MSTTIIHKILVADDNEILGSSIVRHLHRQGFNVNKTNDLGIAQNLIIAAEKAGQPFDLVISDILMQNRSGVSFIIWLHAQHPEVAVLVVSGFGNTDLLETLLRPDRDFFRKKPVLPQEIVNAIFCMGKKKHARLNPGEIIPCEC